MLASIRRALTTEGRRQMQLEKLLLQWLAKQILPPAPGRPRTVILNEGRDDRRSCHVTPCFTRSGEREYVDLDVRDTPDDGVIMTIRATADRGRYVETIWR